VEIENSITSRDFDIDVGYCCKIFSAHLQLGCCVILYEIEVIHQLWLCLIVFGICVASLVALET